MLLTTQWSGASRVSGFALKTQLLKSDAFVFSIFSVL